MRQERGQRVFPGDGESGLADPFEPLPVVNGLSRSKVGSEDLYRDLLQALPAEPAIKLFDPELACKSERTCELVEQSFVSVRLLARLISHTLKQSGAVSVLPDPARDRLVLRQELVTKLFGNPSRLVGLAHKVVHGRNVDSGPDIANRRPRIADVPASRMNVSCADPSEPDRTVPEAGPRPSKGVQMPRNERHVVPNSSGGWDIVKPGAQRSSGHRNSQDAAIDRAREIVHNDGGGEVVIHRPNGQIRDSDTISPGNDPAPPYDTR